MDIVDDDILESDEMFLVRAELISDDANSVTIDPAETSVAIGDDDGEMSRYCELSIWIYIHIHTYVYSFVRQWLGCYWDLVEWPYYRGGLFREVKMNG